jgi:hypothetical protein
MILKEEPGLKNMPQAITSLFWILQNRYLVRKRRIFSSKITGITARWGIILLLILYGNSLEDI